MIKMLRLYCYEDRFHGSDYATIAEEVMCIDWCVLASGSQLIFLRTFFSRTTRSGISSTFNAGIHFLVGRHIAELRFDTKLNSTELLVKYNQAINAFKRDDFSFEDLVGFIDGILLEICPPDHPLFQSFFYNGNTIA
ncbi:unnamed protein product [Ambrosiozyma monospora]|uniref:Unnamed protein product n=1 Tax=Ambrosiozyma monospora TaxID=43982 RepID=A0A9W6WLJ3_AMBMO|nr:unnamed protein product [Ambrosiozyma monospora]